MINYLRSEIYRNLRLKGNYLFILGAIAFVVFLNGVLWMFGNTDVSFSYNNTKFAFSSLYASMKIPMYLCICVVSLIFGQEYKNNTLKNTISFGISRSAIYLCKLLMTLVYALIAAVFVISAFIISAYILLENSGIEYLTTLIKAIIASMPLLLIALTIANCFYFITDKEMSAIGYWVTIIVIIPSLLSMAGRRSEICNTIASYMPVNLIGQITFNEKTKDIVLAFATKEGIMKSIAVAIIFCSIFYFMGLEIFKRKEIK